MSIDIVSVSIQAKSEGIDAATKSLNSLADAADRVESSSTSLTNSNKKVNDSYAEGKLAAEKLLQQYQKQVDLLGATVAQTNAYNVSQKGGSALQQEMARSLGAQVDAYKALSAAQSEANRMNKAFDQAQKDLKKSGEDFITTLKMQADRVGLTGQALRDYNAQILSNKAAQLGVSDQAAGFIKKLQETETASGHAARGVGGVTREIIVLGHEMSQGQFTRFYGSLMVLAERVDLTKGALEGFKGVWAGLVPILNIVLSPITIILGVMAAGVATWYKSTSAIHEFNQELILTGNYAGTTADDLYKMTDAVGQMYGNLSKSREAAAMLVSTGKFTAEQINEITKAAVGLYTYGGVSIEKTIAQFEKLAKEPLTGTEQAYRQVSKAALELDEQLHFLQPLELQEILNAEKLGDLRRASAVATHALAKEEQSRTEQLKENMTALGDLAHKVGSAFTNMWNGLWVKQADVDKLKTLQERLARLPQAELGGDFANRLRNEIADLSVKVSQDRVAAETKANKDEINMAANVAQNYIRILQDREKNEDRYTQEVLKYKKAVADAEKGGISISKEQQDIDLAYLKKTYGEKVTIVHDGIALINSELAKMDAANEMQKKDLENQVKVLDKAYKDGLVSIQDYVFKKNALLEQERDNTTALYTSEISTLLKIADTANLTAVQRENVTKKIQDLSQKYIDQLAKENLAIEENSMIFTAAWKKAEDAADKASQSIIDATKKRTATIQAQIDAYNSLPEAVRKAGVTEKQMSDEITQAQINALKKKKDALEELTGTTMYDADAVARYTKEIQALENERDVQSTREAQIATNKAIQDYNKAWAQANKTIGDDLASTIIDGGGKGWRKLINDMKLAFAKLILNPIIQPISSAIASFTTQVLPGSPSAVSGNGAIGLAQTASNLYSAISSGFSNIGTMVSEGIGKLLGTSNSAASTSSSLFGNIGGFASGVSGIGAGYGLNKAISGQYQVSSGLNTVENIATVASSYFGPVASTIVGAVSGLINRAFGMGSKNITSQGISGTISDEGVTGQSYQNWLQKGGWFRSDKRGTDTQALSTDVVNTFTSALTSLKATSTDFAKNLNVSSDALNNYSKTFDITLTNDATKNQQAITDFFTTMGDDMATKLIPNIANFAKTGETASTTLQRLSETFAATNQVAQILGRDMATVFGGLGLESAKARQYLVDLAGGISNLNSQVSFYSQNFLTDAEKIAPVQKALNDAFKELGVSGITTVDQFKALVNSLDLTKEADAKMFESLMQLAPAFKQVADAADVVTKSQIDLYKNIAQSDFNSLSNAITKSKNDAQAAYDAQTAILNAQISSLTTSQQLISDLTNSLDSALKSMTDNTALAMTRAQAQVNLDAALNNARKTGQLPTADSLKNTLSALAKDPAASFSSYSDYVKDIGITAGKISNLNDIAKVQSDSIERQITYAKNQLEVVKNTYDMEVAKYDAILSLAQQQLDAMNGTEVAIRDLTSALIAFNTSVSAAIGSQGAAGVVNNTGKPISATPATNDQIYNLYQSILGRAPDAAGYEYWIQAAKNGATASQIAAQFMQSKEYINGSHAGGLDSVPFDGYTAKLHKGEMVLPAKQANSVAKSEDVTAIAPAMKELCEELMNVLDPMGQDITKLRKLFQQIAPGGDRLQVHEVGA